MTFNLLKMAYLIVPKGAWVTIIISSANKSTMPSYKNQTTKKKAVTYSTVIKLELIFVVNIKS